MCCFFGHVGHIHVHLAVESNLIMTLWCTNRPPLRFHVGSFRVRSWLEASIHFPNLLELCLWKCLPVFAYTYFAMKAFYKQHWDKCTFSNSGWDSSFRSSIEWNVLNEHKSNNSLNNTSPAWTISAWHDLQTALVSVAHCLLKQKMWCQTPAR